MPGFMFSMNYQDLNLWFASAVFGVQRDRSGHDACMGVTLKRLKLQAAFVTVTFAQTWI